MMELRTVVVQADLLAEVQRLVELGWADTVQDVVNEALRRYLESRSDALAEHFFREDMTRGLRGTPD